MPGRALSPTVPMPRGLRLLLGLLVFSAFFTQTKFIPTIKTNFGLFEIVSCALFAVAVARLPQRELRRAPHPVVKIVFLMTAAAALSQLKVPGERLQWSLIDLAIQIFFLVFLFVLYRVIVYYRVGPDFFLRKATYAILIVGPWILIEGVRSAGSLNAVGPFRNRAHMGFYMLTAFWLVLLFRFWPNASRRDRLISHAALALSLYAVAVSGRRSVYVALLVGLAGLAVAFLATHRRKRAAVLVTSGFVLGFMLLFYVYGASFSPRAAFFQERIDNIGATMRQAVGSPDDMGLEESFVALQRRGAIEAFRDNPLLGIGWGGFYRSPYSPTGHEMHSTPLRFLAELGLTGMFLYVAFMGYLLITATRLAVRLRSSPWGATYLILALALWSLSVSYLYNRHVTERTFWLLLVVFFSLEALARTVRLSAAARGRHRPPAGRRVARIRPGRPAPLRRPAIPATVRRRSRS